MTTTHRSRLRADLYGPLLLALLLGPPALAAQTGSQPDPEPPAVGEEVDMKAMMERARRYTRPGEKHEVLERFEGEWETAQRITMQGAVTEPEAGATTCSWLMEGYWMQCRGSGTLMGMAMETFLVIGYDNFKQSYVTMTVGTMDTAMLTAEGDLVPGGDALITYGTVDEYLTGEHDKMVRYVWRFVSDDEIVLEVHDLPIGETGTQVIENRWTRSEEE